MCRALCMAAIIYRIELAAGFRAKSAERRHDFFNQPEGMFKKSLSGRRVIGGRHTLARSAQRAGRRTVAAF